MKWKWENDGEPDVNGDYELTIENNAGNRISTFKGKTKDDIINGLAESQVQANRRLGALLVKPDKAQPPQQPAMTEADRVRLASGVTDPSRVVETVTEIAANTQRSKEQQDAYYLAEANAFTAAHPDYYPIVENQNLLFKGLMDRGYDLTRNNLAIVFDELNQIDALEPWPDEPGNPPAAPANGSDRGAERGSTTVLDVPAKPVARATGLRNSDANASRPLPPKPKPAITRAELEKMSRQEYNERLKEPAFRKAVDALG